MLSPSVSIVLPRALASISAPSDGPPLSGLLVSLTSPQNLTFPFFVITILKKLLFYNEQFLNNRDSNGNSKSQAQK